MLGILFKLISDAFLIIGKSKSFGFFLISTDKSKKLFLMNSYSKRASPMTEVYSTKLEMIIIIILRNLLLWSG